MPTEAAYGLEIFGRFFQYPLRCGNEFGNTEKYVYYYKYFSSDF
jgi:hypothetical protein